MERYHGIKTSESTVYRTLIRNGMRRLPKNAPRRAIHTKRYAKKVPGHHIQVDVKFLSFKDAGGRNIRRFQYTAIDFINYVIDKFPFPYPHDKNRSGS